MREIKLKKTSITLKGEKFRIERYFGLYYLMHDRTNRLFVYGSNLQKVLKKARFLARHDKDFVENINGGKRWQENE